LTPGKQSLLALTEKVEKVLIPKLIEEVERLGSEGPFPEDNQLFIERIKQRGASYRRWKNTYKDDFIPFAHGIRTFGTYYNDLIKPDDPYEFIKLLKSNDLLAFKRNKDLKKLAEILKEVSSLQKAVTSFLENQKEIVLDDFLDKIRLGSTAGDLFASGFKKLLAEEMNVYYENASLADDPAGLLKNLLTLSLAEHEGSSQISNGTTESFQLEQAFLEKAGPKKQSEALNWLRVGRLSWKLRDDDNVLLGKLENQLYLYLKEALRRLQITGILKKMPEQIALNDWQVIMESLINEKNYDPPDSEKTVTSVKKRALKPRQLVGQPSSGGLVTGKARVISSVADFKDVAAGEILVFDAVQPQMTFIITLAAGIIERRGGMLVHSSIIARELKIPAVNGVSRATELIETGDLVTLNGDLGLVVIGEPEFDLEHTSV
jgi:pyruvate,water dikinase